MSHFSLLTCRLALITDCGGLHGLRSLVEVVPSYERTSFLVPATMKSELEASPCSHPPHLSEQQSPLVDSERLQSEIPEVKEE